MFTIARLHTRVRSTTPIAPERLAAWEEQIAAQDGDALASRWVHEDEWLLIRRLPMALRWRADAVDADVGRQWHHALALAIQEALAHDDGNCVRYRHRRAALADLLYRSALRDARRQWAWQRMGLIPRAQMACEEVLRAGAEQLLHEPALVWPVLMRLVRGEAQSASFTAVLRGMPVLLWTRLLQAAPRSAPYVALAEERAAPRTDPAPAAPDAAEHPLPQSALALLQWAAARPYLAQTHRQTLAVLLAALAWPAHATPQRVLRQRLAAARQHLAKALPVAPRLAPPARAQGTGSTAPAPQAPAAPPHELARQPAREAAAPQPPELPEPDEWQPTRFGGALFWLGRFGTSGVLDTLAQDDQAPADALRLLLCETALALGVPADDPAMSAFCGGEVPAAEAPPGLAAQAAALVQAWSTWLDQAAPTLAEPRIATVCQRAGRLRIEPGWIELHLPLSEVDTAIRRLGLDLDPGWLPWLGCALRICYDDA
ncbi:MAG: hypothetical protein AB1430_13180 [Pseudomonadota bacterium]